MSEENLPPDRPNPFDWAPVCPQCREGALLAERFAVAAQSADGEHVAVVRNVPRQRCHVCGHKTLGSLASVKTGCLLAAELPRASVSVIDYEKHDVSPDVEPLEVQA